MRSSRFGALAALLILSPGVFAQAPPMITMDQEPHHHLSFTNDYVKVFRVEVAGGDSIRMHRNDHDAITIAIGDQKMSVGFPDKPNVRQENPDGQLRLQKTGYVYSTKVDPGTKYLTVAVELLLPQGNPRNLCAAVMAGEPLNCPSMPAPAPSSAFIEKLQFQSDQTRVHLARVSAEQGVNLGSDMFQELIVVLDPASLPESSRPEVTTTLRPGDFFWIGKGGPGRTLKNTQKSKLRFVRFEFLPIDPKGKLLGVPRVLGAPRSLTAKKGSDLPVVPSRLHPGAPAGDLEIY